MKKVLLSVPELYFGGAEKQFRFLIDGLSKNSDIKLDVIIEGSCKIELNKETEDFIRKYTNVNFIKFKSLDAVSNKFAKMFSGYKMRLQLSKVLKRKKYDVILGYGVLYMLNLPYLEGKADIVIHSERGDGKLALKNALTKYCSQKADLLICNSQIAFDRLKENNYQELVYIHNGVEIDKYFNDLAKNRELTILVPARIEHIKNQMEILKAVNILKDKIDLHVNFAGEPQEEQYYRQCLKYVEDNEIQEYVTFMGPVGNIYEMYKNCDLVILASFSEGTPNVVLESFAYKRMCIASNIIMNDVLFKNKDLLFSPKEEQELAQKILEVSEKKDNGNVIEENYMFVKENYSVDAMVENFTKTFEKVKNV